MRNLSKSNTRLKYARIGSLPVSVNSTSHVVSLTVLTNLRKRLTSTKIIKQKCASGSINRDIVLMAKDASSYTMSPNNRIKPLKRK